MNSRSGTSRIFIPLLFPVLILTGVLLRLYSHVPVLTTDLVYISGETDLPVLPDGPSQTAVRFYTLLDQGKYGEAWDIAMEPVWGSPGNVYRYQDSVFPETGAFSGWLDRESFIRREQDELGAGGYGIRLNNVTAVPLDRTGAGIDKVPVFLAESGVSFEEMTAVRVSGHILGACTVFSWKKDLLVVRVGTRYKVLLEGIKQERRFFYQSWFSDITKIKDLRNGG